LDNEESKRREVYFHCYNNIRNIYLIDLSVSTKWQKTKKEFNWNRESGRSAECFRISVTKYCKQWLRELQNPKAWHWFRIESWILRESSGQTPDGYVRRQLRQRARQETQVNHRMICCLVWHHRKHHDFDLNFLNYQKY